MTPSSADIWLRRAADTFGTPAFVYFADQVEEKISALRDAFGDRFALSFAVKSNPNPDLLAWLNGRVAFLDVSSIGELRLALAAGWEPSRISFTGPGKRDFELAEAIAHGVGELVLESVREARVANTIAGTLDRRVQNVLIRIAPNVVPKGFGDQMAGRPSPFGIDVEDVPSALPEIMRLPHLKITGLHIYSGTQCLNATAIAENYRVFLGIFQEICQAYQIIPEKLVFGSGLGVPYHDTDAPLDLAAAAQAIGPDIDLFRAAPRFANTCMTLELGRYLVAEAGYFVTRVISLKQSRGVRIAVCDGGMNNHLPASGHFGMVIRRNYSMHKVGGVGAVERVDLVGPLCTSIDRLGSDVPLPRLEEGDLIAVHNSGAYGLTASPIHFISHAPPLELMLTGSDLKDVSRFQGGQRGAVLGAVGLWLADVADPLLTLAEGLRLVS